MLKAPKLALSLRTKACRYLDGNQEGKRVLEWYPDADCTTATAGGSVPTSVFAYEVLVFMHLQDHWRFLETVVLDACSASEPLALFLKDNHFWTLPPWDALGREEGRAFSQSYLGGGKHGLHGSGVSLKGSHKQASVGGEATCSEASFLLRPVSTKRRPETPGKRRQRCGGDSHSDISALLRPLSKKSKNHGVPTKVSVSTNAGLRETSQCLCGWQVPAARYPCDPLPEALRRRHWGQCIHCTGPYVRRPTGLARNQVFLRNQVATQVLARKFALPRNSGLSWAHDVDVKEVRPSKLPSGQVVRRLGIKALARVWVRSLAGAAVRGVVRRTPRLSSCTMFVLCPRLVLVMPQGLQRKCDILPRAPFINRRAGSNAGLGEASTP